MFSTQKKLSEQCHFNIDQSQCQIGNILPVEQYYTLILTALTFITPVVVLVCAYCGLVKQVIYMEENMEKIGLGKGSRKNGSTTTNHIDNIVMGVLFYFLGTHIGTSLKDPLSWCSPIGGNTLECIIWSLVDKN